MSTQDEVGTSIEALAHSPISIAIRNQYRIYCLREMIKNNGTSR